MKTKRILAIVLVLAMALSLVPMAASAEDANIYTIWTGSQTKTAGTTWWDWLVWTQVNGSKLTEGGTLVIRHNAPGLGLNVVLKGPSNSWAQIWTDKTSAVGDGYETVVSYADMLAIYGTADLSDVAEIDVYMSAPEGTTATATEIRYEYPSSGEDGGEEEEPAATYVVAGDAALCGTAWNPNDSNNLMTDEDGDGVYTKVYENVAAGWPNFKVVEILPDGTQNWLTDQEDKTWSMWLETKAGDTVTITYEPATGAFTYVSETPSSASATYVVAGEATLCGSEWDATDANNQMTDEDGDGVYTKVYTNVAAGWPQFKVVEILPDGTQNWLTDQPESWNMWVETQKGDTVTITYEPATGAITYTVTQGPALDENAYLCCADDGWWPVVNMESDYQVTTNITGEGTYTLSWNLNDWGWQPVEGLAVMYIDITNYNELWMYDVENVVITADGTDVPVTQYKVKTYNSDGYYRIELYNMYSGQSGAVAGDLAFAENLTVTFDLVKSASYGDETNLVLFCSLMVVSMLGVVALVVTKKKFA